MNLKNIRLFVFDVDGTTFDHSIYAIREQTLLGLQKLKQKGYLLCLSTSRSKDEMKDLPETFLGLFDVIVSLAGCCIEMKDHKITHAIRQDQLEAALHYMDENEITYRYATKEGRSFMNRHEQWVEDIFYRLYHMVPERKKYEKEEVLHINYYLNDHPALHKRNIESIIPNAVHTYLKVTTEITPEGVDKATELLRTAGYYGLNAENVCAFGDGDNDISMLKAAGFGIAMGNGTAACREAADYVCEDIREDGFYKALCHFGFIE